MASIIQTIAGNLSPYFFLISSRQLHTQGQLFKEGSL
jgi:hypothetical protein